MLSASENHCQCATLPVSNYIYTFTSINISYISNIRTSGIASCGNILQALFRIARTSRARLHNFTRSGTASRHVWFNIQNRMSCEIYLSELLNGLICVWNNWGGWSANGRAKRVCLTIKICGGRAMVEGRLRMVWNGLCFGIYFFMDASDKLR